MRILIADDSIVSRHLLDATLRRWGYEVVIACDGNEAWRILQADDAPKIAILDWMMPGLTGPEVCSRVRANVKDKDLYTYILLLSSKSQREDLIEGMESGADDYLTKPYAFVELLARIDALMRRRSPSSVKTRLQVGDLELDLLTRGAKRNGSDIDLQPREFRLLEYLMKHAGQVVTRTMLLENVWDYHFDPQTNVIDVHISRLRSKIDKNFGDPLLHTVRGAGYTIRDSAH